MGVSRTSPWRAAQARRQRRVHWSGPVAGGCGCRRPLLTTENRGVSGRRRCCRVSSDSWCGRRGVPCRQGCRPDRATWVGYTTSRASTREGGGSSVGAEDEPVGVVAPASPDCRCAGHAVDVGGVRSDGDFSRVSAHSVDQSPTRAYATLRPESGESTLTTSPGGNLAVGPADSRHS